MPPPSRDTSGRGYLISKSASRSVQTSIALLACLLIYAFLVRFYLAFPSTVEDSFIIFRYASHAATHHGLTWNPGLPRDQGLTGIAWASLLAFFIRLSGEDATRAAGYGGLAIGCATLIIFYAALRRIATYQSSHIPAVGAFSLALSPYFLRHSANGMETSLAFLLYAAVIYVAVAFPFDKQLPAIGITVILAMVSFYVRPDAPLFTLATFVSLVFWRSSEREFCAAPQFLSRVSAAWESPLAYSAITSRLRFRFRLI
jgi:hypothetical protein